METAEHDPHTAPSPPYLEVTKLLNTKTQLRTLVAGRLLRYAPKIPTSDKTIATHNRIITASEIEITRYNSVVQGGLFHTPIRKARPSNRVHESIASPTKRNVFAPDDGRRQAFGMGCETAPRCFPDPGITDNTGSENNTQPWKCSIHDFYTYILHFTLRFHFWFRSCPIDTNYLTSAQ